MAYRVNEDHVARPASNVMQQQVLVFGEPLDNMPKDLYIPPDALRILLETFEGPLDLLLYLIRKHNIDILNIPVAMITEQYLAYVAAMKAQDMSVVAEYLLMAATLTELKARMMLPMPPIEEGEEVSDPRATLAEQLIAYAQNSQAADYLANVARVGAGTLLSAHTHLDVPTPPPPADMALLLQGMSRLVQRQTQRQAHQVEEEAWSLSARMASMQAVLAQDDGWHALSHFYDETEGRGGQVVSLMAMLELDKRQQIVWQQSQLFAVIQVRTRVVTQ